MGSSFKKALEVLKTFARVVTAHLSAHLGGPFNGGVDTLISSRHPVFLSPDSQIPNNLTRIIILKMFIRGRINLPGY